MRNESFAMLNQKKKREKFIGVLNFKCNGLLSREEMELITDSIDSGRQYSVRLFFDSERFKALSMDKNSRTLTGTEMPKTIIRRSQGMDDINQICILIPPDRTKQGSPYVRERI